MTFNPTTDSTFVDTIQNGTTIPDFHNYNGKYNWMIMGHRQYMPEMFFYLRINQPPKIITYLDVDGIKAIEAICKAFEVDMKYSISHTMINSKKDKRHLESIIIQVTDKIMLSHVRHNEDIMVLHTDDAPIADLHKIDELASRFAKERSRHRLNILVFEMELGGFHLNEFKLPEINFEIEKHYNDDFLPINNIILQRLSDDKGKGIVLLHGAPGTGKTSYIRHLVNKINKKLIYIPSNLARRLGDPDFLPFLQDQKNSVLIIEDAEDILKERTAGDNGTMANLLNLGDGLLSDCLNIQIICTFNAPLTRIDKALLRKGRVIASYEFKPLTIEKSNALLKSLDSDIITTKEMTLAEVFYEKDRDFLREEGVGMGFGR